MHGTCIKIIYSTFRTEILNYYRVEILNYYRFRISDIILQEVTDEFPFLIERFKSASQFQRGVEYCLLDRVVTEIAD